MQTSQHSLLHIPPLIAHRGASHRAPENTLPSFQLAVTEGADGIEGDFWLTADGELVCIHDPTTERTAPGQEVADVRLADIAKLKHYDVGSWKSRKYTGTGIPLLGDILAEMNPAMVIYIEIKQDDPQLISILNQIVTNSPVSMQNVRIISFSSDIIRQTRQLKNAPDCSLLHDFGEDLDAQGRLSPAIAESVIRLAVDTGARGVGLGNCSAVDEDVVRLIRRARLEFHVWTVNEVTDAIRYISLGADSLTTDRPAGLRKEIQAHLSSV